MRSAKKTKVLSALSMAAGAALGMFASHSAAQGATITLMYGNDQNASNSNNFVAVGTSFNPNASDGSLADGGNTYLGGTTIDANAVNAAGGSTITLPVGDYLSLAIDAVITGNLNSQAGQKNSTDTANQPSWLGLLALSVGISSTDSTAKFLTPLASGNSVLEANGYNGHNTYSGMAAINGTNAVNGGTTGTAAQAENGGGGVIPNWSSLGATADVQPNEPGYDQGTGNGNVGLNGYTTGGSNPPAKETTAANLKEVQQFAPQSNVVSYNNATDFEDSIMYQGLAAGTVTLTPYINQAGTAYWVNEGLGSASPDTYTSHNASASDSLVNAPTLVVVIPGSSSHAVINLSATANSNYGSSVGTLSITGSSATGYSHAQDTALTGGSPATGSINTSTWASANDPEIFGIDVQVNGVNATTAQLASLIAAINGDGVAPASTGFTLFTSDPSGGHVLAALDTATVSYNLFLDYASGGFAPSDVLGLDFSNGNDTNLNGYSFSAVSVVPEPMSLSLLALGGLGLMSRRHRRKA